jgi:hypothetical protein
MPFIMKLRNFKCRVYILRCINLTAVDSRANIKDRLIGYGAMCSADPYPRLFLNDGKQSSNSKKSVKEIKDEQYIESNLNPSFY